MAKEKIKARCWKKGKSWFGYLEDYPEYVSQGKDIEELEENLRELYREIKSETLSGSSF